MAIAEAVPQQAAKPQLPVLLSGEAQRSETESISFDFADLNSRKRRFFQAAWTLRREGIIRIKRVVEPETIQGLNQEIAALLDDVDHYTTSGIDNIAYLNLPERRVLKGYNNFVDADRAVINHRVKRPDGRSGSDAGMIDIFHPEQLSEEINKLTKLCLQETIIRRLIMLSCLTPLRVKCRNLYLNRGVRDTRSYHCDGRSLKFKSFVYLSDVHHLGIGPYCYVKKSQRNRRSWRRSRAFNQQHNYGTYEYSQLDGCEALPVFADAGDMVISSQRGAHRGHPQHPDAERTVLVNMYQR